MLKTISAAVLLAVVAAGCGDGASPRSARFHGVPRALAQVWEGQARAIATAASAGNGCQALRLAKALRTDVIAKERDLPVRLRSPLLDGVNSLAGRITCTPPVTGVQQNPPKPPKPPHEPHDGHHHGHGHGGHGDGRNDQ
jgi:hypothetical protein